MKLYLDNQRTPPQNWQLVKTVNEAIEFLKSETVEEISLDFDLDGIKTGNTVAHWILKEASKNPNFKIPKIFIHTKNPIGRKRIEKTINKITLLKEIRGSMSKDFINKIGNYVLNSDPDKGEIQRFLRSPDLLDDFYQLIAPRIEKLVLAGARRAVEKYKQNETQRRGIQEVIRHEGNKWNVYSKSGEQLGSHDTEKDAKDQLAAIEINKHKN